LQCSLSLGAERKKVEYDQKTLSARTWGIHNATNITTGKWVLITVDSDKGCGRIGVYSCSEKEPKDWQRLITAPRTSRKRKPSSLMSAIWRIKKVYINPHIQWPLFSVWKLAGDAFILWNVLGLLPRQKFVHRWSGLRYRSSDQALAKKRDTLIHALEVHQQFFWMTSLERAKAIGRHLVKTYCMDMKDIPKHLSTYRFALVGRVRIQHSILQRLSIWASCYRHRWISVISEMSWLRDQVPMHARVLSNPAIRQAIHSTKPHRRWTSSYKSYDLQLPKEAWVEAITIFLKNGQKSLSTSWSSVRDFAVRLTRDWGLWSLGRCYGSVSMCFSAQTLPRIEIMK
jgi:hypothetical protein